MKTWAGKDNRFNANFSGGMTCISGMALMGGIWLLSMNEIASGWLMTVFGVLFVVGGFAILDSVKNCPRQKRSKK